PKAEEQSIPSIDIDSDPGFGSESTRVAAASEVDQLLADVDDVEKDLPPAPPPSGVFKAPTLPEPGSKLPSGRFQTPSGRFQTPSGRFQTESGRYYQTPSGRFDTPKKPAAPAEKPAAPPPEPVAREQSPAELDLEVEMELGAAVEQAVTAPPPVDEDFYDDIVVEAARESPSAPLPVDKPSAPPPPPPSERAAARAADDDQDLFEVTVDAEDDDTKVSSREALASDPDRTPLPIGEGADELGGAQPLRVMQLGESRPVVAVRIAVPHAETTAALPT